jgi:quercetin dioxygenase-like cupin family protein
MTRSTRSGRLAARGLAGVAAVAASGWLMSAAAQTPVPAAGVSAPGFEAKPIQTSPVSGDEQREVVLIAATLQPGGASPPHTHPGDCVGTVIEGQVELRAVGKEARRVGAGDAFANARGTAHQFVNVGDKPARLVTALVVDKGKPRTLTQAELK